jgi:hypothetical protein
VIGLDCLSFEYAWHHTVWSADYAHHVDGDTDAMHGWKHVLDATVRPPH